MLGGIVGAWFGVKEFGWLGFIIGGLVGVVVSFGGLMLAAFVWAVVESLLFGGIPYLPPCKDGKCKSGWLTDFGDYEPERDPEHRAYFRCRCGHLYWRNRTEGRVLEVLPDGTTKPYMVWRSFRGWYPEDWLHEDGT